jgi:DNA-binding XRE family transcriptional regulator
MTDKAKFARIQPKLEDLLPTAELRVAYEEASAALEAGQLVRALRKHARLSQVELAERLGVEQPRISAIEAGRGRDGPSYALLKRIVLACEVPWFIPDAFSKHISNAAKVAAA